MSVQDYTLWNRTQTKHLASFCTLRWSKDFVKMSAAMSSVATKARLIRPSWTASLSQNKQRERCFIFPWCSGFLLTAMVDWLSILSTDGPRDYVPKLPINWHIHRISLPASTAEMFSASVDKQPRVAALNSRRLPQSQSSPHSLQLTCHCWDCLHGLHQNRWWKAQLSQKRRLVDDAVINCALQISQDMLGSLPVRCVHPPERYLHNSTILQLYMLHRWALQCHCIMGMPLSNRAWPLAKLYLNNELDSNSDASSKADWLNEPDLKEAPKQASKFPEALEI